MSPFSDFFRNASHEEKEKLFLEVAKQASEDQKKLLEKVAKNWDKQAEDLMEGRDPNN